MPEHWTTWTKHTPSQTQLKGWTLNDMDKTYKITNTTKSINIEQHGQNTRLQPQPTESTLNDI